MPPPVFVPCFQNKNQGNRSKQNTPDYDDAISPHRHFERDPRLANDIRAAFVHFNPNVSARAFCRYFFDAAVLFQAVDLGFRSVDSHIRFQVDFDVFVKFGNDRSARADEFNKKIHYLFMMSGTEGMDKMFGTEKLVNDLKAMGINANYQSVVKGIVLLIAVMFDVLSKRQKR